MTDAIDIDAETRVQERPGEHRAELRLWLRLLTCANMIEAEIRSRLRENFGATLPRFDLMAQLEKSPEGMTLGALSRRMMVSNGNLTGLVEKLVELGLVARVAHARDRRATVVRLTEAGRDSFAAMAAEHGAWVAELFAGLAAEDVRALMPLLARMKDSVRAATTVTTE